MGAVVLACSLPSLASFGAGADGFRQLASPRRRSSRQAAAFDGRKPITKLIARLPGDEHDADRTAHNRRSEHDKLDAGGEEKRWVVVLQAGTTKKEVASICQQSVKGCSLISRQGKGGFVFLEIRGPESLRDRVLHCAPGAVKYVELDQTIYAIPEMVVEFQAEAAAAEAPWGLNRIGASQRSGTGVGVHIFVLDTGVRVSHQEFSGRAFPALDMTGDRPKECKGDMYCAADWNGHGTHCAAIAAGMTHGVALSASVQGIKILADDGSGASSWIYYALGWLATNRVRPAVASMSVGGRTNQRAMKDAVDGAVSAGVTVVVAAGNENDNACMYSPAFVLSAITVGSTTPADARSQFSNFGRCVQIWAPGSDIPSANHKSPTGIRAFSGTSMACPHVAGGAALVLEADPRKSASEVADALLSHAVFGAISDLGRDDTNLLLYIGEGSNAPTLSPAPTLAPGWCPENSESTAVPGICWCSGQTSCYDGNTWGCPHPEHSDRRDTSRFHISCSTCACRELGTTPAPPPGACPEDTTWYNGYLGICECRFGFICYKGNRRGCPGTLFTLTEHAYVATCDICECKTPEPTASPPPTPQPPPSTCNRQHCSAFPDRDGDCMCNPDANCFENGTLGCTASITDAEGHRSDHWFLATCNDCQCIQRESAASSLQPQVFMLRPLVWLLSFVALLSC